MKTPQTVSQEVLNAVKAGKISQTKVDKYLKLLERIKKEILPHEVITDNKYSTWFKEGKIDLVEVKHFLVQFSVFSNLFLIAQLKKTINAPNLEAMHASKEILMNELGVVFRPPSKKVKEAANSDNDSELVQQEGTVDGGNFF